MKVLSKPHRLFLKAQLYDDKVSSYMVRRIFSSVSRRQAFFFLSMLFVAGIARHLPALPGISLAMVAESLVLHGWLVQRKLVIRRFPSQQSALSSETFGMEEIPP